MAHAVDLDGYRGHERLDAPRAVDVEHMPVVLGIGLGTEWHDHGIGGRDCSTRIVYYRPMALVDLTVQPEEAGPVTITLPEPVTEDVLTILIEQNPEYRLETTADGRLVVSPLTGTEASIGEGQLYFQVESWNRQYRLGFVTPSSGGITLVDGAIKGPDTTFISRRRMAESADRESARSRKTRAFRRIAPDVVFELLSPSDNLKYTISKCEEYIATGSDVSVLLNPRNRSVTIYRPGELPRVAPDISAVTIGDEMSGLSLNAQAVFDAGEHFA